MPVGTPNTASKPGSIIPSFKLWWSSSQALQLCVRNKRSATSWFCRTCDTCKKMAFRPRSIALWMRAISLAMCSAGCVICQDAPLADLSGFLYGGRGAAQGVDGLLLYHPRAMVGGHPGASRREAKEMGTHILSPRRQVDERPWLVSPGFRHRDVARWCSAILTPTLATTCQPTPAERDGVRRRGLCGA